MFEPSYISLKRTDAIASRADELFEHLKCCDLCPRLCRVDRTAGQTGFCRVGQDLIVSSAGPHFGEEKELVGVGGSGTIFLTSCNLLCVFCQNSDISHGMRGLPRSCEQVADLMLGLQRRGCHNINLVTPTHFTPQIVRAIDIAAGKGLKLPMVYNCGGYERVETLRLLEGIVDIYMPDAKFSGRTESKKYLNAADYPDVVKAALKEMHRQVGDLQVDERGVATRGLLVRHLVMPGGLAGSAEFARFIAEEVSPSTYVNVMGQYHPEYRAFDFPELLERDIWDRFFEAQALFKKAGVNWRPQ